jgi:GT2 family glycosyltransferase
MTGPHVNITIATYNRLDCTKICIETARSLAGFPHQIVVVDNASTDGTREYLQELLHDGIIHRLALLDENMVVACAYNLGWELAPADYFMKVDNDVRFLRQGWLAELVRLAARHPDIAMLGFGCTATAIRYRPAEDVLLHHQGHVGGCVLIRRDILEQLGWWNEDYGLYGEEDSDFGLRARLAGFANVTLCDAVPYMAYTDQLDPQLADYARWKQQRRRDNLQHAFVFNDALFKCGLRPFKVGRRYLAEVAGLRVRFRPNRDYLRAAAELESRYGPHLQTILDSEELRRINEDLGFNFWF